MPLPESAILSAFPQPFAPQAVDLNTFEVGTAASTSSTTHRSAGFSPTNSQHGLRIETGMSGLTSNVYYRIGYLLLNREGDAVDTLLRIQAGHPSR